MHEPLRLACRRACLSSLATAVEVRNEGPRSLFLFQADYIIRVLERLNMQSAKSALTPLPINLRLAQRDCPTSGPEGEDMKSVLYAPTVGSLMYAMVATRRRSRQQIYAQSRPIALERSQACVQISNWHKRPRHSFKPEPNLRHSRLHRLGLSWLRAQSDTISKSAMEQSHGSRNSRSAQLPQRPKLNM